MSAVCSASASAGAISVRMIAVRTSRLQSADEDGVGCTGASGGCTSCCAVAADGASAGCSAHENTKFDKKPFVRACATDVTVSC